MSGEVILDGKTTTQTFKYGYLPEERGLYTSMKVGTMLVFSTNERVV
jgi:ABC-type uncharacterized transport system ATPase subunit